MGLCKKKETKKEVHQIQKYFIYLEENSKLKKIIKIQNKIKKLDMYTAINKTLQK